MTNAVIIGVGQTAYEPAKPSQAIPEMVLEAVERALADARIGMEAIDAVVTASVDLWDGRTASNIQVTEVVGAVMKPEARVAGDGLLAAIHAAMTVGAGAYGAVLVAAHCKMSEGQHCTCSNWAVDPICQQPLGLDFLSVSSTMLRNWRRGSRRAPTSSATAWAPPTGRASSRRTRGALAPIHWLPAALIAPPPTCWPLP